MWETFAMLAISIVIASAYMAGFVHGTKRTLLAFREKSQENLKRLEALEIASKATDHLYGEIIMRDRDTSGQRLN